VPTPREAAKSDWVDGRDILLEDNQTWTFPLPRIRIRFDVGGDLSPSESTPQVETNRHFGPEYDRLQDEFREFNAAYSAEGSTLGDLDYVKAIIPLAASLLRRNYDLTDDQLSNLLIYIPGDARNFEMWDSIRRVAMGIGPKA
jgi:hypothetical protein